MITVLGQDSILTTIAHQHLRNQVHHSLFFQGEHGVGKLETALWFAQGYFCYNRPSKPITSTAEIPPIACGKCRSCLEIEFFHHPHILLLTVGDRLPALIFWQQTLFSTQVQKQFSNTGSHPILHQLGRDISQLLARYRQQFLDPVIKEKTTYREGVKMSSDELEKLIHKIHLQYQSFLYPQKLKEFPQSLMSETFISDMKKLQNSLDRSVLTKDSLNQVMAWCKHNNGEQKLVIIENIELINHGVVGLFLKILEDPPPQVSFILITEDMDNLNQEVTLPLLSRCLHLSFNPLTGHINEILKQKFHFETGFINHESNFQLFFQKHKISKIPVLEFLLQPIYRITSKIQDKDFQEENIISELYHTIKTYIQDNSQSVKINYRQALSILQFINENYYLVKKNNYNKTHFLIELSLFIKKILKHSASIKKN